MLIKTFCIIVIALSSMATGIVIERIRWENVGKQKRRQTITLMPKKYDWKV